MLLSLHKIALLYFELNAPLWASLYNMVPFEHNPFEVCGVPGLPLYPYVTGRPVLGHQHRLELCFLVVYKLTPSVVSECALRRSEPTCLQCVGHCAGLGRLISEREFQITLSTKKK